jgi:hypothetical protein
MHCSDLGMYHVKALTIAVRTTFVCCVALCEGAQHYVTIVCHISLHCSACTFFRGMQHKIGSVFNCSLCTLALAMKLHHSVTRALLQLCLALALLASFTEALEE